MVRRALLVASFLMVSSAAGAQTIVTPPTQGHSGDVVVLKDGTVLHGTVGEMTPNQSLTITIDGQPRKIDWKDVERVDIDRAKAPPQQAAARAMTFVHIDGPPDVVVQTMDKTEVCKGACDRELPTDGVYRVDAPRIRTSRAFHLEGPRAEYHVKTASSAAFAGGLALVIAGGVALVNGLSFFLVATIDQNVITQDSYDTFMLVGGVLTGIGAAALIGGGILLGTNLRTSVVGATTVRVPAWRDAPQLPSSRFAAVTFPAFSGSF